MKEAVPGDKVQGLDADLNDAVCEVTALGYWGQGTLYGNYTPSHYIRDDASGNNVLVMNLLVTSTFSFRPAHSFLTKLK